MSDETKNGSEEPARPLNPIGGLGKRKKAMVVGGGGNGLSRFFKSLMELASMRADSLVMPHSGRLRGGYHYNHGGGGRTFKCHRRAEVRANHKRRVKATGNPRIRVRM